MTTKEIFSSIEDPRLERNKLHSIEDIFTLTLLAVICGVKSWEGIELFGKMKQEELKGIVSFKNGVPSHDTIERVYSIIHPDDFGRCFISWTRTLSEVKEDLISIDGKTARRTHDRGKNKEAIHLVSAWANKNQLVLGQIATAGKGHEIKGIKELLCLLDIQGCIISIDAIGCQKDIAEQIIEQSGDYILALKENQAELKSQVEDSFNRQKPSDVHQQIEKAHGRIEERKCSIITDLKWIDNRTYWMNLQTIIRIESCREKEGVKEYQTRYYISSSSSTAEKFNHYVRGHWGIENSLHWKLDVVFREDECRKRKGYSAQNFTLMSKMAINLLKRDKRKITTPNKQFMAGWNTPYLVSLIKN